MHNLNRQIFIFSQVVKYGSFKGAADNLQLSPSVVSHHISDLEKKLGITLLYRTTRQLSLTSDGKTLLPLANNILEASEKFISVASSQGQKLIGELTVTLPAVLAQSSLIEKIGAFSVANPKVKISLDFSDERREIISDNFDLAIRMGKLDDSSLKCKKLYNVERTIVVSPSYFKSNNQSEHLPEHPNDLGGWNFIELSPVANTPTFKKSFGESVLFKTMSKLSSNNAYSILTLTLSGAGFSMLPAFLVSDEIAKGSLMPILKNWPIKPLGVYAVWPANAVKGSLVKTLINDIST